MKTRLALHASSPMFEALYGTHQSGSHAGHEAKLVKFCQPCANVQISRIALASHVDPSWIGVPVQPTKCQWFADDDNETGCPKLAMVAVETGFPHLTTTKVCAGHAAEFILDLNKGGIYHHETYLQINADPNIPFGSHACES